MYDAWDQLRVQWGCHCQGELRQEMCVEVILVLW